MARISGQCNVAYWSYCPKQPQNGSSCVLNRKNVVLLLGKVENDKYTKTETWHPEYVEEFFYYRLCENF